MFLFPKQYEKETENQSIDLISPTKQNENKIDYDDTFRRKNDELEYDFFRKQFVARETKIQPDRKNKTQALLLPQHQYEDDEDVIIDQRTNFLPHLLKNEMKDDEYDQYLFLQQQQAEKERNLQKRQSKSSFSLKEMLLSSFSWKFSSSKKVIPNNREDSNTMRSTDPLSEKIDEAPIVYKNKTIDHSLTNVAPVTLTDEELELFQESDTVLKIYRNLHQNRDSSTFSALLGHSQLVESSSFTMDPEFEGNHPLPTAVSRMKTGRPSPPISPRLAHQDRSSSPTTSISLASIKKVEDKADIRKRLPIIEWNPEKAPKLTFGQPLTREDYFDIVAKTHKGKIISGKFFYDPIPGTILPAGKHKISATFIPDDTLRYLSTSEERFIEIEKKKPTIKWNYQGRNILYLTPLPSAVYSCLECEIPGGTYEYSHPVGIILELGVHQLNVKYYPDALHASNYTYGYAKMALEVSGTIVPLTWNFPVPDQFDEEKLMKDEAQIKKMIVERKLEDKGKPGCPLVYSDNLPMWIFTAKCLVYPEQQSSANVEDVTTLPTAQQGEVLTEIFEVEGEYIYSAKPHTILPAGFHTITVTFHPTDRQKYHTSTASRQIYIYPNVLSLYWKKPYALIYGEPLDHTILNCEVTPSIRGEFIYTPPAGTILPRGTHTLTVKFIPTPPANYLSEETTQEMMIRNKKQLKINWFPPEEIIFLTPLGYEQLNASLFGYGANSKGTFVYNPPHGTILPVGEHTLTVKFCSENVIFEDVSASVKLTVLPCNSKLIWTQPNAVYEGESISENVLNCICTNTIGEFKYSIEKGSVLRAGEHKLTVRFSPYDGINFLDSSTSVKLLVRERPKFQAKLHWKHPYENTVLEYGFALNGSVLNAQCSNFHGSFSFKPPLETVLPAGYHELFAYFTPEEPHKCLAGSIQSHIIITKRTPLLIWHPSKGYNEKTKLYELEYGQKFHQENYLTAYTIMSESDGIRVVGDFIYSTKKGNKLIKKITFNPKKSSIAPGKNDEKTNPAAAAFSSSLSVDVGSNRKNSTASSKASSSLRSGGGGKDGKEEETKKTEEEGPKEQEEEEEEEEEASSPFQLDCGEHIIVCKFIPFDLMNFESVEGELSIFVTRGKPPLSWNITKPTTTSSLNSPSPSRTNKKQLKKSPSTVQIDPTLPTAAEEVPPFPKYVYPFSLALLPRPLVINKTIAGKFQFELFTEETIIIETSANILPDQDEELEEGEDPNDLDDKKSAITTTTTTMESKIIIQKRIISLETLIDAGKHKVIARFYPEDINNYLCNEVEIEFAVIQAVPIIVWEPTTVVTFGTILTKYQHGNAYCTNVANPITGGQPGEFVYDPPMGTMITIALADKYNPIDELIAMMKQLDQQTKLQQEQQLKQQQQQQQQQQALLSSASVTSTVTGATATATATATAADLTAADNEGNKDHNQQQQQQQHHYSDMKIQNNANNRILIESIAENYNASQHNTHYLKIELTMNFIPYNLRNYETRSMKKELIIERKSANLLWTVPYKIPYGSYLDEKILNAELSEQDVMNIQSYHSINNDNRVKKQQQHHHSGRKKRSNKQQQRSLKHQNSTHFTSPTAATGRGKGGGDFTEMTGEEEMTTNHDDEDEDHRLTEEEEPLYRLEYDPPLGTLLNFTQKEFMIKVTFLPLQNLIYFYNETIKILYLDIYPIAPTILWKPKFTSLQEGNPLEKKFHCNATVEKPALFPGELVYDPPIGSLLTPGHYNLICEYLPKYVENELPTKTVKHFEVVKRPPKIVIMKDEFTGKVTVKRVYEGMKEQSPPSSPKRSASPRHLAIPTTPSTEAAVSSPALEPDSILGKEIKEENK